MCVQLGPAGVTVASTEDAVTTQKLEYTAADAPQATAVPVPAATEAEAPEGTPEDTESVDAEDDSHVYDDTQSSAGFGAPMGAVEDGGGEWGSEAGRRRRPREDPTTLGGRKL